eukprot:g14925.t1
MSKSRRKTSTLERKRLIRLAEKYLEPCLVRLAEVGTLGNFEDAVDFHVRHRTHQNRPRQKFRQKRACALVATPPGGVRG